MLNLIRMEVETGISNLQDICVTTNKYISVQLHCLERKKSNRATTAIKKGKIINGNEQKMIVM